ncbi:hypothetical protein CPB83DRAFT_75971 [Crepidotus variabilis]|uniref:Leucine-rich repeat-containing protein n=1 Tax=Crepidotus variabilis TaxID=179855 RepID=A0A9P6EKQ8_9AGAR|nr:hypothetical protein CPB83DRAFT_75971 [Crepidotus variabilis]
MTTTSTTPRSTCSTMEPQPGDEYIREFASFIRANERGLAESGPTSRRLQRHSSPSLFSWLSTAQTQSPVVLQTNVHHLFYVLIRLEALGFPVGSLDVHVNSPSRPMNFPNIFPKDRSDALSLASFRSSFSAVSSFSLGGNWWSRSETLSIDMELKYIFSSLTKLPALSVGPPSKKVVQELMDDPPGQNAIPLDSFRNLQRLECEDIDPRTLLGWDRLSESLRSLKVKNSGLQDVTVVFIGAVRDDKARREGSASRSRYRDIPQQSISERDMPQPQPSTEPPELSTSHTPKSPTLSQEPLSSLQWAFLKHLYLPDNGLTFFPPELIPLLKSLTHLDLSSNLLVSVPSGLGDLYNLISLNLKDNLIDSVLGIYRHVGQVLSLVLSHNRLESICGLERLMALERIDLRHNLMEESSEIGRLSVLPNIRELWVKGNPFVEFEDRYRISCFEYFFKEGKDIVLDGTGPSAFERRNFITTETTTPASPPPPLISSSAHVIAVEHSRHISTISPTSRPNSPSPSPSPHLSPSSVPGNSAPRRKKGKRIVDFTAGMGEDTPTELKANETLKESTPPEGTAPETIVSELADETASRKYRHSRHQTEYAPSTSSSYPQNEMDAFMPRPIYTKRPSLMSGSATMSSRSDLRRARVSASVFEPTSIDIDDNAETYRKRVEVLKRDMGESWLKVYKQSQE